MVREIVRRTTIPKSCYKDVFMLVHQWAVALILRCEPFGLTDLLLAQQEDMTTEKVGGST